MLRGGTPLRLLRPATKRVAVYRGTPAQQGPCLASPTPPRAAQPLPPGASLQQELAPAPRCVEQLALALPIALSGAGTSFSIVQTCLIVAGSSSPFPPPCTRAPPDLSAGLSTCSMLLPLPFVGCPALCLLGTCTPFEMLLAGCDIWSQQPLRRINDLGIGRHSFPQLE